MKIYIAGPMRGYENFNFGAFDVAQNLLENQGHVAVNPAEMDRLYEGWSLYPPKDFVPSAADSVRFIRRDLAAVEDCDAVYMLRGWEESKGALVEKTFAEFLGLDIIYEGGEV